MNIRIFSILAILIVCSSIFTQSIPPALAQAPAINNLTQPDSVSADDDDDDDDNNNNKRTIKPSEDAYVNNDNQSSNYGKSKYLKVSRNNDSYLKFKVSDSVKKATLRLYLVSGRSKSVSVYSTSTSWSEKKITWKNRPKAKDKLDTSSAKSKYIEFDVTDGVKKGTISFVLKGDSSNFYSRDGKKDPELIVNGSGSSPETTPKPTKTPRPGDPNPTDEPNPTDGPNPTDEPEPTDNPNPTDPPIGGGPCEPGFDCEPDSTPDPNDPGPGDECNTTIDCDNDGEPGIGNNFPTPTPGASAANRPTNTPTSVPGGATNPPGGSTGTIAPDANTKIAYIGDTADGQNHKNVLKMIHAENASAIVHLGDLSYGSDVVNFEKNITAEFGPSFPHFIAKGNHDGSSLWTQAIGHMNTRNALTGLFQLSGSPSTYDFVFKGIKFGISEGGNPATITSQFASDNHIWKVCGWHYNMQWIQIGGKGDEAEWASYNNCRQYGAMVVMGHEHSYERTKTLTKYPSDTSANAADLIATGDAANLTVSRGSNFSVVSGAGGTGMRDQERCNSTSETAGGCNIWASIRTSTQGATFGAMIITYNPGGNRPREAEGIYKEVTGNTGVGTVTDRFTIRAN